MDIRSGQIGDIVFYGDFMAAAPLTELCGALRGVKPEPRALEHVFDAFDLPVLFGGIRREEVLSLLLDEAG